MSKVRCFKIKPKKSKISVTDILGQLLFILFCVVVLSLSLRGLPGSPSSKELNTARWIENGPFELSPERGRYALLYSLIEDHSLQFSLSVASFAAPDVGFLDGKYVSLFAPGVSLIAIPGYLIGKYLGSAQVGSFAIISLFALINSWLVRSIAIRLGGSKLFSTLGSLAFLFATPSFTYAVTLYQHHISTFLILFSIYILLRWNNFLSNSLLWLLFIASILVDYPNVFLMFPIIIYSFSRSVVSKWTEKGFEFKIPLKPLITSIVGVLPLAIFLWLNQLSYNNPLQLSGSVKTVKDLKIEKVLVVEDGKDSISQGVLASDRSRYSLTNDAALDNKNAAGFFNSRDLLNGFYVHLLSPDRGALVYAPIVIFGVIGTVMGIKKKNKIVALSLAIVGINVLLYSLWGDPWGGWAFGSRYLIPSYALLSIFIGLFLTWSRKNLFLWSLFIIIFSYSVAINTAGAITSSSIPPKIEVLAIEKATKKEQKYTFEKNFDYLKINLSKSYVFQSFAKKYINAWQYYFIVVSLIIMLEVGLIMKYELEERGRRNG